ncbi:MAG TPA: hypothetical protein VH740_16405 [Vicinamibacterales bacterium]
MSWTIYAVLFASTSVIVGVLWDISWHQTIGRDTFWTPAHLAIYLGGLVAGVTCGWLALRLTFAATPAEREETVRFWGFRAPLGAWICIWGSFAMLTSAPFDDWWHNAYGLDVKILSPPHAVLAAGIGAIQLGAMLMAVAAQNRSNGHDRRLQWLFLYSAGLMLLNVATLSTEYVQRWDMHRALFYQVVCGVFPVFLVSTGRASTMRWPATIAAGAYSAVVLLMVWILPLFAGRPLLGPIYVQLDRFLPPDPPLLLIVPAIAIDLVMRKAGRGRDWRLAAVIAIVFVGLFTAAQWHFASFLMSDWSHNWIFATDRMAYMVHPIAQERWQEFNPSDDMTRGLLIALPLAFLSSRVGLWRGTWMARVRR